MTLHHRLLVDADSLLRSDPGHWDRLIAADLAAEIKEITGDKSFDIPEMRRFLAAKGYRDLKAHLVEAVGTKTGAGAIRAAIIGMRTFAHMRPGISAATFRTTVTDCPEWRQAGGDLAAWLATLMAGIGLAGEEAQHALRVIRSFVRGFVIHEMQSSFLEDLEHEDTLHMGVDLLVDGLCRRGARAMVLASGGPQGRPLLSN